MQKSASIQPWTRPLKLLGTKGVRMVSCQGAELQGPNRIAFVLVDQGEELDRVPRTMFAACIPCQQDDPWHFWGPPGTPPDEKSVFSRKWFRQISQPPQSQSVKIQEMISEIRTVFFTNSEKFFKFWEIFSDSFEKRRIWSNLSILATRVSSSFNCKKSV